MQCELALGSGEAAAGAERSGEEDESEAEVLGPRDPFNCPQLHRKLKLLSE